MKSLVGIAPSPLPFGVQSVPYAGLASREVLATGARVSIAFRRSVSSLQGHNLYGLRFGPNESPLPFGVQSVPYVEFFVETEESWPGLHCLSAFSQFPTVGL